MFVVEQEPKKHPNINFRVGNPYLIVLIKEGILGYPNLINCLGPFLESCLLGLLHAEVGEGPRAHSQVARRGGVGKVPGRRPPDAASQP